MDVFPLFVVYLCFPLLSTTPSCHLILLLAATLADYFIFFLYHLFPHTCVYRQLPHAPENPVAVLSTIEKRSINLTWAQAFDGNSPLIRYILEVSENSECVMHFAISCCNTDALYSREALICFPYYYFIFPLCP